MNLKYNKELALNWLRRSQRMTGKGFSAWYIPILGWAQSYPETTGYIIPTMLRTSSKEDKKIAQQAGDWLLTMQMENGAMPCIGTTIPLVFDTGQVIFGMTALYKETHNKKYLESAKKAGDWIIKQQDSKGYWIKHAYQNMPHTYYSRVSWALLELWKVTKDKAYKRSAEKQLTWVLKQQQPNGFFHYSGFFRKDLAVLHTIAYTLEGLIESGKILKDKKLLDAARKTCNVLVKLSPDGIPYGHYDDQWRPKLTGRCITGIAQTALCLIRLDTRYKPAAEKMLKYLCDVQNKSNNPNVRGALPGSVPFWGWYMPFRYINWAAKFFIDAIDAYQAKI